jgi:hypothetical protein
MKTDYFRLGLVGSLGVPVDEAAMRATVANAYDELLAQITQQRPISLVAGLTNKGINKIGYEIARERGWHTAGIACFQSKPRNRFAVDTMILVGANWGDESETFLDSIDALVRIGGGPQAMRETAIAKSRGLLVIERDVPREAFIYQER